MYVGKKMCEQCHAEKDIELFRKVTNQYTGVHPMGICKECYQGNQEARQQKQAAEWEARKALREKEHQESEEERLARQERERIAEQKLLAQQQALEAWYLQQPDRQCVDCKQVFPASAFGYSMIKRLMVSGSLRPCISDVSPAMKRIAKEIGKYTRFVRCARYQREDGSFFINIADIISIS